MRPKVVVPRTNLDDERVGDVRRCLLYERVGGVQRDVVDDGEEPPSGAPVDDDVPPHRQPLNDRLRVQFHLQPFGETAAHHDAQPPLARRPVAWAQRAREPAIQFFGHMSLLK